MDRALQHWWNDLDDRGRRHGAVIAICGLVYLLHYLVFCVGQPFFIEDAAITFAYARNLADGEGLVSYAGGERVEGYSNALWTFLISAFYVVGIPGWVSSKVLGAVFGLMTLPLSFAVTRRALAPLARAQGEDSARPTDDLALLAPLLLALSPQIAIWNASGLENSLFGLLLTASAWRVCVEHEREAAGADPRPWSALLLLLLTMTRPDGMMYAAVGLAARLMSAVANRRGRGAALVIVAFAVPFVAYNAWRFWYFAWPFPNTYYAKLGTGSTFKPFGWTVRGWKQIIEYFMTHRLVYALPLLPVAMTGLRGWRRFVGLGVVGWLSLVVLWDGRAGLDVVPGWLSPISDSWIELRVWSLLFCAILVGLTSFGRRGWLARGILWASFCGGIFFVVYSGNDWMKAWRWFNLIGFSMFPLLVVGLVELLDGLPLMDRRLPLPRTERTLPSWALAVVPLTLVFAQIEGGRTLQFVKNPETSVRDIQRRVVYMSDAQRQLDLDHITLLDVDMGAHLYFTDWRILDIAGLAEVPMARHRKYDKAFMREYLFDEEQPDFGHVHSAWARSSKINTFREWKERYLEIPGYPIGNRKLHVGNHVRKGAFVTEGESFPGVPMVAFDGGIRLLHHEVRSPVVPNGGELFLHLVFQAPRLKDGFSVLVFLDDGQGHRAVSALTPGFGWYPAEDWKRDEQVHGRFRMPVSADLVPGEYQLGLVLMDERSGKVHEVARIDGKAPAERPARYMTGEYLAEGITVRVTSRAEALSLAEQRHAQAFDQAAEGDCEGAWEGFKDATRHVLADLDWRAAREKDMRTAVATCFAAAAAASEGDDRIDSLLAARKWDHRADGVAELARPEAAELAAQGDAWFLEQDWERAYDAFALALRLDPRLSHVRRRAEDARDYKLGIRELGERYPPDPKARRARREAEEADQDEQDEPSGGDEPEEG